MKKILNSITIQGALLELLAFNGAMDLIGAYDAAQLQYDPSKEINTIASQLCGSSNRDLAIGFMNGENYEAAFFENVSYNSPGSIPFIVRAINIRLMQINALKEMANILKK